MKNLKTHNHTFKEKRKCDKFWKRFLSVIAWMIILFSSLVFYLVIFKSK